MNAEINDNDRRFMQMACELAYAKRGKGWRPIRRGNSERR